MYSLRLSFLTTHIFRPISVTLLGSLDQPITLRTLLIVNLTCAVIIDEKNIYIKAQTGVPDTLVYLQTIVANKTQYIGQPFSTKF